MQKVGEKFSDKRGQVTVFIIIGVAIVALGILVYLLYPTIKSSLGLQIQTPATYMQDCMQNDLENLITKISAQGGSVAPGSYILYKDQRIEFLCYTNEYYKPCVMQKPDLMGSIKSEIYNSLKAESDLCFDNMKKNYENSGYDVSVSGNSDPVVEILPNRVGLRYNADVVLTRGETQRFNKFSVVSNNNLYELVSIASSILNWETSTGDTETTTYMFYYQDLKVEKNLLTDGAKIYTLTNRVTGEKFQFASRSYVFPPGY